MATPLLFLFGNLEQLDAIVLNWSPTTIHLLNFAIGFIMFGVALKIKPRNFTDLAQNPKPIVVGTVCQYLLLPAITFALVMILRPSVGVALGMILVAACPGANVSNLFSAISRSNVALAISLTAITVPMSLIMTPLNFWFWGWLYMVTLPDYSATWLVIDPIEVFRLVFLILGLPVILGMFVGNKFPVFAKKSEKIVQGASLVFFVAFIAGALGANFSFFLQAIHLIFIIALIHNASAFWIGYRVARWFKIDRVNSRTISFETGVQNSGLGLALFFTVFPPELRLGGIAVIAAWWGVWQVIPGLMLSFYWRKRPVAQQQSEIVVEKE